MLLLFEKRTARSHSAVCDDGTFMFPKECIWLTACGGGDEKTQAKKVKLPPPAGTPSLLQKRGRVLIAGLPLREMTIRQKNRKTKRIVGAQQCVRPKYTGKKENR